ncbi:MAG: NYN domain-containing protein [Bacteroidetes bacterium]|nr:MAG: NYN domain-containing protein [Bacteroidota bacterium]
MRPPKDPSAGFFFMARIIYYIDGFNLYHSIISIQNNTGEYLKWLDVRSLCNSYLPVFGKKDTIVAIYYFTAIPKHLSSTFPGKITRHNLYLKCLKETGINVILGRFKEKTVYCKDCSKNNEIERLLPESFSIKLKSYRKHQFPDPFTLPDGTQILKPAEWKAPLR